jgi:hypothetical protein
MRFCRQAPGKVFLLQIGPYFAQNTLETVGASQCDPWGGWPARLAGILVVRWAWPAGDRRRAARGSPRLDSRAYSGRRRRRWACAAKPGDGGRGGLKAGEGGDGAGQSAAARAPVGPRGGFRVVVWRQARARGPRGQGVDLAPAAERLGSVERDCARVGRPPLL